MQLAKHLLLVVASLAFGFTMLILAMILNPFWIEGSGYILIPGMLLAGIAYPQGIHTGSGAAEFVPVMWVCTVLFYLALMYTIIIFRKRRRAKQGSSS